MESPHFRGSFVTSSTQITFGGLCMYVSFANLYMNRLKADNIMVRFRGSISLAVMPWARISIVNQTDHAIVIYQYDRESIQR